MGSVGRGMFWAMSMPTASILPEVNVKFFNMQAVSQDFLHCEYDGISLLLGKVNVV